MMLTNSKCRRCGCLLDSFSCECVVSNTVESLQTLENIDYKERPCGDMCDSCKQKELKSMNKLKKIRLKHDLEKKQIAKWLDASVRTVERLEKQTSDDFGKYNNSVNAAKFYYDNPNMHHHLQQILSVPDGV